MKKQNNWKNQKEVFNAADQMMAAKNCGPYDITGYDVAKSLGMDKPNGQLYKNFRLWQEQNSATNAGAAIAAPASIIEPIFKLLDNQHQEHRDLITSALGTAYTELNNSAELKITAMSRKRDAIEHSSDEMIELLTGAESDLQAARDANDELTAENARLSGENEKLAARNSQLSEILDKHISTPQSGIGLQSAEAAELDDQVAAKTSGTVAEQIPDASSTQTGSDETEPVQNDAEPNIDPDAADRDALGSIAHGQAPSEE
ncbi:hypothetical protein [Parasphingorhabdus sp. NYA22]